MTNIQAIELLKGLEQSLDDYCELNDEGKNAFRMAVTALELFGIPEQLPSAQQERPKGNWVEIGDEPYDEWECDVCGFVIDGSGCIDPEEYRDVYKFCPTCGADMRGKKKERQEL